MAMQSSPAGGGAADVWVLISRILAAAVFIRYGWPKFMDVTGILNYPGTKRFMDIVAGGAPAPAALGYLIGAVEVFGGLAILIGFKTRWAAWGLAAYLVIATYLGHNFWDMEGAGRIANQSHFYKNLAIMAAFLLLAVHGPGRYALDSRSGRG